MDDWKQEANKRRNFRQLPYEDEREVIPYHCRKTPRFFCIEYYSPYEDCFYFKKGWKKWKTYKKQKDAETAAEKIRVQNPLIKGFKLRILDKNKNVVKEYEEIPELVQKIYFKMNENKDSKDFLEIKKLNESENNESIID